jgi:hypothetical protein
VTLRGGTTVDCLSDGRSPAPHWDWAGLLAKARAVARSAGAERHVDPLHEAIAGFSDSAGFLSAALSVVAPGGRRQGRG